MENLRQHKPHHLRQTAPWLFFVCLAYGITNIMIGLGFYNTTPKVSPYVLIHGFFDSQFWGAVFFTVGVLGLLSLISNRRKIIRGVMVLGLLVKSLWFYALLIKISWATLAAIGVWGLIFAIQLVTVIYYPDKYEQPIQ